MGRVRDDLETGRLHGLFVADPSNQEILELLGEVYHRMGDFPQAGRYWMLPEREGRDVDEAFEIRFGSSPAEMARALAVKAPITAFPPRDQHEVGCQ